MFKINFGVALALPKLMIEVENVDIKWVSNAVMKYSQQGNILGDMLGKFLNSF